MLHLKLLADFETKQSQNKSNGFFTVPLSKSIYDVTKPKEYSTNIDLSSVINNCVTTQVGNK